MNRAEESILEANQSKIAQEIMGLKQISSLPIWKKIGYWEYAV